MFCFKIAQKKFAKLILWTENQLMKQRRAGKNKRVLHKTKGCSALMFWAGEIAARF